MIHATHEVTAFESICHVRSNKIGSTTDNTQTIITPMVERARGGPYNEIKISVLAITSLLAIELS